jgi:hypothetical protein
MKMNFRIQVELGRPVVRFGLWLVSRPQQAGIAHPESRLIHRAATSATLTQLKSFWKALVQRRQCVLSVRAC